MAAARSDAVLMASEQPAGKVSTDDEVTPFNTSTAETHVPDEKHIDPDAQALGPGDPNYLDDVPPDAMPQQGATFGDALQAASMSTMPTGLAGGVMEAEQEPHRKTLPTPDHTYKVDPAMPNTMHD